MKELAKNILKRIAVYHPLQSFYRGVIHSSLQKKYRRSYRQYAGTGFRCNVCEASYSQFVPDHPSAENKIALLQNNVIAGYGNNIICPNCLSTERERLVICMLKDKFDINNKKILHLSPEKNVYEYLRRHADVITADLLPGFYKTIDGFVQKQDATKFSYADNSFDMVIANHVLEHIPDDTKAMREMYRVLKPNGEAILQVPYSTSNQATIEQPGINDPAQQSTLFGQKDHVRIYALNDYAGRLKKSWLPGRDHSL